MQNRIEGIFFKIYLNTHTKANPCLVHESHHNPDQQHVITAVSEKCKATHTDTGSLSVCNEEREALTMPYRKYLQAFTLVFLPQLPPLSQADEVR
jgi:hypothetical protein